jgi:transposase
MKEYSEAFVAFDTAKKKHAVAIADVGREGEIRYLGEIDSSPLTIERMIRKLAGRYEKLHFCYEAGPTGYGLYCQVRALGHNCSVVAPSLIPKKSSPHFDIDVAAEFSQPGQNRQPSATTALNAPQWEWCGTSLRFIGLSWMP